MGFARGAYLAVQN